MRLIDADALMADLEKWMKQIDPTHPPEDNAIPPMEDIIVSTLMTIEEQPTIEPQLDEWCDDCAEYDKTTHSCPRFNRVIRETLDDVRKEAYEQGRAMAQRWIPVTERLPEDSDYHDLWETPDGAVLWCKATGEIGVGWYYESTKNWCDLWDNGVKDVIAWMPLPEAFKGEQE